MNKKLSLKPKRFYPGTKFYRERKKKKVILKKTINDRELYTKNEFNNFRMIEEKNEQLLQQLLVNSPLPFAIFRNGKFQFLNHAWFTTFGYSNKEEVSDWGLETWIAPELCEKLRIRHKNRLAGGDEPKRYTTIGLKKDHSPFPIEIFMGELPARTKERGYILFLNNLSGQKKTEEALKESRNLVAELMDTANVMIVRFNSSLNVVYFNEEAEKISGYTLLELEAAGGLNQLIPREICPLLWDALEDIPKTKTFPRTMITPLITKTGEEKIISWQNSLIKGDDGEYKTVSFGIDITSQKEAEAQLKEYAETQKVLLREVNHRVKNNLQSILSIIQMKTILYEDPVEAEPFLELEARIKGLATIHNMLTQSAWKPVKLGDLCFNLLNDTLSLIYPSLSVEVSVTPSPLRVTSTQAHNLALVLNELLTNSVKYAFLDEGPKMIDVTLLDRGTNMVLKYRDNGKGYPVTLLKGDFTHTGLGFEIIRGIVTTNLHGQWVLNNNDGAESIIFFPI